mgnify:CR=1 FL=1
MYFDEDLVLDVRLNLLNSFVDKFIIIESKYDHKGEKREPLFDIKKFKKAPIKKVSKENPFEVLKNLNLS